MANLRTVSLFSCAVCFLGQIQAAEFARFEHGHGHLAASVTDGEWLGLRFGDRLPASSRLRTSPAGPVRIELPAGVLFLTAGTDAELNVAARRIVLEQGRLRIQNLDNEQTWTVTTGTIAFACTPGSEAEFSHAETIGVNVLKGHVHATRTNAAESVAKLDAPVEWVGDDRGAAKSSVPAANDWASVIRRRTEPREEQGLGQLITRDPQSESPVRLEIARYHVNVVLQAPVALVQIDQSFFNPFNRQEEGTFVFNLPEGASVSRFAMFVTPDQLIEGELIDRSKADQVYTSIVRRRRDPAILEQIGSNLFKMRVFPIFAHDTKRILLDYTIPLVADRGRYRFELPLLSDRKPIWDFGITGTVHPPFTTNSITSPTHPGLKFVTANDGSVTFSYQAKQVQPPPNLLIDYRAVDDNKPEVRAFTTNETQQHFVVTIPETLNPPLTKDPAPIDLLVLVDTSGSAGNLSRARLAVKALVDNLRPKDRWQIGCVDVTYRPITSQWVVPRSAEARQAHRELGKQFSLGESRLDAAMHACLSTFASSPENRRRVIVYFGDGESAALSSLSLDSGDGVQTPPSSLSCWKNPIFEESNPNCPEFHAVKVGDERLVGRWLKEGISQMRGRVFTCQGNTAGLRDLFEWALAGLPPATPIIYCSVQNVPTADLFCEPIWPRGRELHIVGRGAPMKELDLKLNLPGQPQQSYHLDVDETRRENDVFTGRLWARMKVDALSNAITVENLALPVRESIVQLCQEWSLMSPFTAFLVLETEHDYERWGIPRRLRHRYWKPAGIIDALPLPEHVRQQVAKSSQENNRPTEPADRGDEQQRQMRTNLNAANEVLSKGNAAVAREYLYEVQKTAKQFEPAEFDSLMDKVRKMIRADVTRGQLKLWQTLIDRRASNPLPALGPLLTRFSQVSVDTAFLERNPHAMQLLKPAPKFDEDDVPLTEFATAIQEAAGVPVMFDEKALSEEGISREALVDVSKTENVSIRSLAKFALEQKSLALVPEKLVLRITTQTAAGWPMISEVYPTADLIRSDVFPRPDDLSNPYLAADLEWKKTAVSKLKQLITVRLADVPLRDALDTIAEQMGGIPIRIHKKSLSEEGISPEKEVSLTADNLPAGFVLDELLRPLALERLIGDGALTVTTVTDASTHFETRFYSAAGIIDETAPDPNFGLQINYWQPLIPMFGGTGGMGMGGFGGMGGGGFGGIGALGGGMGGGFGGFGGFSMGGGMGGGMIGGSLGGSGVTNSNVGIADLGAPHFDEPEAQSETPAVPKVEAVPDESESFPVAFGYVPSNSDSRSFEMLGTVLNNIRGEHVQWLAAGDPEGGAINFHSPTFSFAIRQTQRVHSEIKELFEKLRRSPRRTRVGTSILAKRSLSDEATVRDYGTLLRIIYSHIRGEHVQWLPAGDPEGGSISPHPLTESLVIRQTRAVHEEIERLFMQLRKSRCIAESLPWQTSLEGIDDVETLLDRPTITNLPRNSLDEMSVEPSAKDVLRQLVIRKAPASMNQRWRALSTTTGDSRVATIRKQGTRLELVLPDRTLRADGPRAAIAYPSMTLVEVDDWGDAARQVADALLPWLPHRSNEDLVRLFDMTVDSDDAEMTVFRLAFRGHTDTYLKVGFSKQNGAAAKWQSVLAGEPQYELRFADKTVIAVDPNGQELEHWELIADDTPIPIPAIDQTREDFVVVEASNPNAPLTKARDALRRGDHQSANGIFEILLVERPQQPLLNFFLALSIEASGKPDSAQARLQRQALGHLAATGSDDLLRLVTLSTFPSIGAGPLREILLTVPIEKRSEDFWDKLTALAIDLERYDLAFSDLDRPIADSIDGAGRIRRQILRIHLLLKNKKTLEAEAAAAALSTQQLSQSQLIELGDVFSRAGRYAVANTYYEQFRRIPNLTRREQAAATYHQATWLEKGEERWRFLLAADVDGTPDKNQFLDVILSEVTAARDALILDNLAYDLQPGMVQTRLLVRLMEITDDNRRAADVALKLFRENRLLDSHLRFVIEILDRDKRWREIAEILEERMRAVGQIDDNFVNVLGRAYKGLGRNSDRLRATTENHERHGDPANDNRHRNWSGR